MSAADVLGLVGRTVERIRFDECVDAGGFGIVYRGWHLGQNERVAIKCLRLTRLANLTEAMRVSLVNRLHDETKILHHLSHGTHDIVKCHSSGQLFAPATGEPVPYIVLEWLEGHTLGADLAERRERGIPGRSLRETLDVVESAALAIAHAHTQGIIHRDIKPANLMLVRVQTGFRLKVLDFGLAKILAEPGTGRNVATADGIQLFSAAYCAPEQLSPQVGEIGPWTDIFSLALVMLEVMRGDKVRHPMSSALRASSLGITLPPAIEDLLARATSPNPLERPANANIFWSALRELTRQSTPPVSDAAALAVTAFDGDVAAAMQQVRAATAPSANSATAMQASPFTGTMLMVNAPSGALHMLAPQNGGARAPLDGAGAGDDTPPPGSTAPLARPVPSALPAAPTSPNEVTAGIAIPSPLASSLGPGTTSPVAQQRRGVVSAGATTPSAGAQHGPPSPQPPPAQPLAAPQAQAPHAPSPPRMRSVPPPAPLAQPRGPGLVIALLVVLVLAVGGSALWMLLRDR